MPEDIHPKTVDAALQPEAQNVEHRLDDFGIAPVEVGLFAQEGMVVVLLRMRVVFPSASPKADSQLFGGPPPAPGSRQMYQLRLGLSRDDRDSTNHGCWSEL